MPHGIGDQMRPWSAMKIQSINGRLLLYAFYAAPGAFVAGLFLVRMIKHFNLLDPIFAVIFGAALISDLLWTRREVRRLALEESAKERATQFLWSCVFFSMLAFMWGMAVSGYVWLGTDFLRRFGLIFWSAMMAIAIYPIRRDAKRLADAAGARPS